VEYDGKVVIHAIWITSRLDLADVEGLNIEV
jgi:hypothetical protein